MTILCNQIVVYVLINIIFSALSKVLMMTHNITANDSYKLELHCDSHTSYNVGKWYLL